MNKSNVSTNSKKRYQASGYSSDKLDILEDKAKRTIAAPKEKQENNTSSIVFSVKYFQEVGELRKLLHELKDDINWLVGKDTRTVVACRMNSSIGNQTTANRKICLENEEVEMPMGMFSSL